MTLYHRFHYFDSMANQIKESLDSHCEKAMKGLALAIEQEALAYERYSSAEQRVADASEERKMIKQIYLKNMHDLLEEMDVTYPTPISFEETKKMLIDALSKMARIVKIKEDAFNSLNKNGMTAQVLTKRMHKLKTKRGKILSDDLSVTLMSQYNEYKTQIDEIVDARNVRKLHRDEYRKAKHLHNKLLNTISTDDMPIEKTMKVIESDRACIMAQIRYDESNENYNILSASIPSDIDLDKGKQLVENLQNIEMELEGMSAKIDTLKRKEDYATEEIMSVKAPYIEMHNKYNKMKLEYDTAIKNVPIIYTKNFYYAHRRWLTAKNKYKSYYDHINDIYSIAQNLYCIKMTYHTATNEFNLIRDVAINLEDVPEEQAAEYASKYCAMRESAMIHEESHYAYTKAMDKLYVAEKDAKHFYKHAMEFKFN